jgi:hypothetical protein
MVRSAVCAEAVPLPSDIRAANKTRDNACLAGLVKFPVASVTMMDAISRALP